jgi:peptide/nickel transport system substrate-binding protein
MNHLCGALVILSTSFLLCTACEVRDSAERESTRFVGVSDIRYDGYAAGSRGGRFVSAFVEDDPKTFNPALAKDPIAVHVAGLINAALVRRNQRTMEWEPWLAEKWEISDGGTEINFHLREGLRWSDGKPIIAGDWVFAEKVALTPGIHGNNGDRFFLEDTSVSFRAIGDMIVSLVLPVPYSGAFEIAAAYPIPEHILGPVLISGVDLFNAYWGADTDVNTVVGSGPFVVSRYIPGRILEMTPNPHYFERDIRGTQLPYLDTYIVKFVDDGEEAVAELLTGEIDHYTLQANEVARVAAIKGEIDVELYDAGPNTETQLIAFNQNPAGVRPEVLEWMTDKSFRIALSRLVDRKTIIEEFSFGFGYPAVTFIPTSSPYYWSGADAAAPGYDPERAKQLLDRSGYRDRDGDGFREDKYGNIVELTIRTNDDNAVRMAICEQFARSARVAGIKIGFLAEPFNAIVTRLISSYDWELLLIGFAGEIDPIDQGAIFLSSGSQHIIEPGQDYPRREWEAYVDGAWNDAATALDEGVKKAAFELVQRTWIEEAPWVYTYSPAVVHAYKRRWGNIFPRSAPGYGLGAILPRIYQRSSL